MEHTRPCTLLLGVFFALGPFKPDARAKNADSPKDCTVVRASWWGCSVGIGADGRLVNGRLLSDRSVDGRISRSLNILDSTSLDRILASNIAIRAVSTDLGLVAEDWALLPEGPVLVLALEEVDPIALGVALLALVVGLGGFLIPLDHSSEGWKNPSRRRKDGNRSLDPSDLGRFVGDGIGTCSLVGRDSSCQCSKAGNGHAEDCRDLHDEETKVCRWKKLHRGWCVS